LKTEFELIKADTLKVKELAIELGSSTKEVLYAQTTPELQVGNPPEQVYPLPPIVYSNELIISVIESMNTLKRDD